ncbi:glycoside hydrolase superfamily [Neurospora hispaniola]|uniref:Glycoside hydrolase superfamily n=1 Tax=Neurospora hispaniola TaxID=588809 RepID=A0AAJ0HZ68_9PEZI|nr:glycoside hydrolase superfamily [Neurospora hispaniola]
MKFSIPVSRLVLVASLLGRILCVPLAGNDRLGDHPYDVDQQVRHVRTRYQPSRLVDIPLHVDDTAPKAVADFENDERRSALEPQTPSKGIGKSIEAESVTLAARGDASTDQADTAVTGTAAGEVEDVAIYMDENSQTDSTETKIIPIISPATPSSSSTSSSASSSSSSSPAVTTLKPKTKRTNLSSYLSFNKANQKLIKPIKHTKLTNTPPSTNDDTPTILPDTTTTTTTFTHPGFLPQRLPGITYAPYDLTGCRSPANITSDFATIAQTRLYSSVRIYGVDCSQVLHTLRAASSVSSPPLKLFLGIFSLSDLSSQLTTLIKDVQTFALTEKLAVDDVWTNMIDTISVGNELVNNGQATPAQVLAAVRTVRQVLRREGYFGPVVTVDTFVAVLNHPELCSSSDVDYCAVNVHPFFDAHTEAERAGEFVRRQVMNLREVITPKSQAQAQGTGLSQGGTTDMIGGGERRKKRVVVTETGWPKQGNANYRAVPGRWEQKTAVEGVMKAWREGSQRGFVGDDGGDFELYLFTAFDDEWKKADKGTFYAEQFWGIHDR